MKIKYDKTATIDDDGSLVKREFKVEIRLNKAEDN